jgi:hypothetical protein
VSLWRGATARWPRPDEIAWYSPEELVAEGYARGRVVMVNEAHNGQQRSVRTRQIGVRMLPVAWRSGARLLAMEALGPPGGQAPEDGYLEQPDMAELIESARRQRFAVAGYDADMTAVPVKLRTQRKKPVFANWRDGQQAANLARLLEELPGDAGMLVWCGNLHHSKVRMLAYQPMGWQFRERSGVDPFVIDQTVTVDFGQATSRATLLEWARDELARRGGHAGFLLGTGWPQLSPGSDACILSLENELT